LKKAVTIFLLCLYTLAAFGATVRVHYCMGRLINWSLIPAGGKVCSNCGMPKAKSHGCCHDELRTVKMHADHKPVPAHILVQTIFQPAVVPATAYFSLTAASAAFIRRPVSHAPPIYPPQKLYLQNCVLLI
jgi:hypothetical protein